MYFIKIRLDRSLGQLQKRMQKMVEDMLSLRGPFLSTSESEWAPEVDIYETDAHLFVVVNLAGVKKEAVEVSFCAPFLRIRGKRGNLNESGSSLKYHQLEMGRGDFERVCRLPVSVEEEESEASCEDGLLTIRMKKRKRARSVSVEVSA
jgi:HSP20 family protein